MKGEALNLNRLKHKSSFSLGHLCCCCCCCCCCCFQSEMINNNNNRWWSTSKPFASNTENLSHHITSRHTVSFNIFQFRLLRYFFSSSFSIFHFSPFSYFPREKGNLDMKTSMIVFFLSLLCRRRHIARETVTGASNICPILNFFTSFFLATTGAGPDPMNKIPA